MCVCGGVVVSPKSSPMSPGSQTRKSICCFPNTQVSLGALPAQNPFPSPNNRPLILFCDPNPFHFSFHVTHVSTFP